MKKMDNFLINRKGIDTLQSMLPVLHNLKRTLEHVANERVINEINSLSEKLNAVMHPVWQADNQAEQSRYDYYRHVQEKNNFKTIWSADDVEDFSSAFPYAIKTLTYYSCKHEFATSHVTWLDIWQAANQLIIQTKDLHHCFIEGFTQSSNGHFVLTTGS